MVVKKEVGKMVLISESSKPSKRKWLKIIPLPKCFSLVPNQASLLLHPWSCANPLSHHPITMTDPERDELVTWEGGSKKTQELQEKVVSLFCPLIN